MAESVVMRTEDTVDELELMEKLELFTKCEIKKIIKKREEFEYKLSRHNRNKEDILQYIDYEITMLKLVRARKLQKELPAKKSNIEYTIANRVKRLFNDATIRYSNDVKIWISYIKFCKQIGFYSSGSQVFQNMLNLHGDKPSLFKFAANWELEECKNIDKARACLQSGLHIHKDSEMLYLELFRVELIYINMKVNEEQDKPAFDSSDPIYKLIDVIYDAAMRKIHNVQFLVDLLERAKPYEFTANLQSRIIADMQAKFPDEELTWDTVAKMALNTNPKKKCTAKERISNCVAVYKKAVEQVNTEKMWCMYLDTLVELQNDNVRYPFPNYKRKLDCSAFSAANEAISLPEKYYLLWIEQLKNDMLERSKKQQVMPESMQVDDGKKASGSGGVSSMDDSSPEKSADSNAQDGSDDGKKGGGSGGLSALHKQPKEMLRQVLQEATDKIPNSIALWEMRLRMHLVWEELSKADAIFNEANRCLQGTALPIWKLMLLYWQAKDSTKVDDLLKVGTSMTQHPNICNPLKVLWLERVALTQGLKSARELYFELAKMTPFYLELHTKMTMLENLQPKLDVKYARISHICACIQFGSDNTDVWLNYLKFEKRYGKHSHMADIYHQACNKLQPSLVEEFKNEYDLELKA